MLITVTDINNNDVQVKATNTHMTVPIYLPKNNGVLVLNLYSYESTNPQIPDDDIEPFVYFCNGSLNIFCNSFDKANYESLSDYAKTLVYLYHRELDLLKYDGDFDRFIIANTDPEDDDDSSKIVWTIGDNTHYYYNDDGTVWTIQSDGTKSHFELMYEFLRNIFEKRLYKYIELCIRSMKLLDKIESCEIQDPDDSCFLNFQHSSNGILQIGVFGTNYPTSSTSSYRTKGYETSRKSVVVFSPFIYFMSPPRQKILIVHELVHAKIGNEHGHDKYFWYLQEFYTGIAKEEDDAYNEKQCIEDTIEYDRTHEYSNGDLIQAHQNWLANGRRGGQW